MKTVDYKEYLSPDEIRQMQTELICQTLAYVNENSPFYRQRFKTEGIDVRQIRTLEDFHQLPVTTKEEIQASNEDFFCVPTTKIVEFVSTSGTTGEPILLPLTKWDLERLAYNEELSFTYLNALPSDSFQIMVNMGNLFVAGLAYYLGLTKLGATTYRIGAGLTQRQLYLLEKFRPNGIVSVPSFLIKLHDAALERGIDVKSLGVNKISLIGEPILDIDLSLNPLGQKVASYWGVRPFSSYGSTEMATSFAECTAHQGLHVHPDLIYFEIIDDAGNLVPDGTLGELAVTTLRLEGMPLIRFRTGDITFKLTDQCPCGRNSERIGPILGRKKHMIKSKGTTLYPGQIEKALIAFDEIFNYVIEVSTGKDYSDEITVKIGADNRDESLIKKIKEYINAVSRVTPEVLIYDPADLEKLIFREGAKPCKFIDLRQQNEKGV